MKSRIVEIVDIVSLAMKPLGENLTSWNRYFIVALPNLFVETSLPTQGQVLILVENLQVHNCQIALIIQVQNRERSMHLICNMHLIASCAY